MGITLKSNGSKISLDGGYGMLFIIRCRVALAWDKEFGEHYAKLLTFYHNKDLKEFDKKTNEILQNERFKDEDSDLLDFFFESDCGGKCRSKTCKKIYDLIKDTHEENLQLRYAIYSKNDWEDFKQLLLDCYSHRANLTWS